MGAAVALGNVLEPNVIDVIDSFLDDSSLVPAYGMDATDIANMDDVSDFYMFSDVIRCHLNARLEEFLYFGSLEYANE